MASVSSPTHPTNPSTNDSKAKPFRFKRKRPHSTTDEEETEARSSHRPRHHHHGHHHRPHRRPHTPPTPSSASPPHSKNSSHPDPDTAFRESLFDALADDEGAAFWEGVYGQPVHTYSPYYPSTTPTTEDVNDSGEPKLERMTDEEYVAYVRSKMWEKSHGYILEERRKREQDRVRRRAEEAKGRMFQEHVEEALRKGEERRRRGRWKGVWDTYLRGWEGSSGRGKESIIWPVLSGKGKEVDKEQVEMFYKHAPQGAADREKVELVDVLKRERVRWHPDKMQQRAGAEGLDGETMRLVTAVFQTVDCMWNELKGKA